MSWGSQKRIHPKFRKVSVTGLRRGGRFLRRCADAPAFSGPVLDYPAGIGALKRGCSLNLLPASETLQKINVG